MADSPAQLIRLTLSKVGVTVTDDELEELAAAHPALMEWMAIVEDLADGAPASPSAVTPA